MLKRTVLILCLLVFGLSTMAQQQFVKVKGHQFTIGNKPYYYIGFNYWYGGLLALQHDPVRGKQRLCKELDFLKSKGINNLRVLAGSEGLGLVNGVQRVKPALQPEHNQYNVQILDGLDYLLYQMAKRKMYAVLFLSNNWEWSGGFLQYLNWNKVITDSTMRSKMNWDDLRDNVSKFYSCQPCIADYHRQIAFILKHYNKYTKHTYINEPAIMAWEMANEPRPMRPSAIADYNAWALQTAVFIKNIDHYHLLTMGTEGAMGTETIDEFKTVNAPKQIDYLTIHIWPKNWGWFKDTSIVQGLPTVLANTTDYIKKHQAVADEMHKPLVLEEFGLPRDAQSFDIKSTTTSRDQYYNLVFSLWDKSRRQKGSIAGCNIWAYGGLAKPIPGQVFWKDGDDFMGDPPQEEQGLNAVFNTDKSTWGVIAKYNRRQPHPNPPRKGGL
jgi:mannan endo-1,4-beta-mannosidase